MTNAYSFIDILNKNLNIEESSIKISKINIPIIQRDYAQGRNDSDTKRIRKRFLQALYDAIVGEPITLDFIYGDIDAEGIMTPLDGQQRLTTLFLLHWYVAKKESIAEEEYSFLNKFSYETRYSARDFCKSLIKFNPCFNRENLSDEIKNASWFPYSWEQDQTISSMLVMIDDISNKFLSLDNIWEKLKSNAITFYFLPIKDMGLTDELYIKMNSRGKPLTSFENFKAEFEYELKKVNTETAFRIIRKIDKEWTNTLWTYAYDSIPKTIDDYFLNYFKFICDIICYKDGESPYETDEINLIKKYFSIENSNVNSNIKLFEDFFDCWSNLGTQREIKIFFNSYISDKHEAKKMKIDSIKYKFDIFRDCISNYKDDKNFTIKMSIIIYAFIQYLLNRDNISDKDFRRRIRIINNLINNSDDEISKSTNRQGGNTIPAILKQVDNIVINGEFKDNIGINFNSKQLSEEKQKLDWTNLNVDKEEDLFELEDSELLYGQIAIIGLENYELFNRFIKLFNCNLDKVNCALMSIGDYSQIDNWRRQLGSNNKNSWKRLFHQSSFKNFDATKNIIVKLLSITKDINDEFLDLVINKYLSECEINNKYEWRYYYIKYDEFRTEGYGKYFWEDFNNKRYEFSAMTTNLKMSENAYQPFLKVIDINGEISREDFGKKIIKKNLYIVATNNSYIFKENNTNRELKVIKIEQDNDGIDKEDRIIKFKEYNKG